MSDGLFDGVLAAGPVAERVSGAAWLQAMLDFEGALALASADAGVIPAPAAAAIVRCCRADDYDVTAIGARAVDIGNPAGPLVRALTARVEPEAAAYVHLGATSQDVSDTAAMLVTARAFDVLDGELRSCAAILAGLADEYADTVMAGRSLLQQAPPVTFGLTAAGWLGGIAAARTRLDRIRRDRLAVQFGGAVGTLAALGDSGIPVLGGIARRLGLAEPVLPWHTERSRIAEVAGVLGQTCGAVAKIARDLTLLAQTEVAEVYEQGSAGTGGSSTMPHKRNPVAAVLAAGAAGQAPGLVAALLGASAHEYQRAAGAWHAEWRPLSELLRTTGSAVCWLRTSLERLRVDPDRMRANLDLTGGLLLAENVAIGLVSASRAAVSRQEASDIVADCCRRALADGGDLIDLLAGDAVIGKYLGRTRLAELLDPAHYLGSAGAFLRRALEEWEDRS
ncbi:3-carboxy-cis,cis-muconate cycloisomerase [Nocardia terpenica]|uniref:3-carboxy-cis,cis-muconate cycloisomerase n=1 Tax=Nocardia terpenica TaxID=455432 RepID=A0A164LWY9_9NOCA|nr:3-carboxy-cis,cis-muconate cycloisomerase [Nocardia terpenica]KZM72826.1 3-carboxy-cis,cis-muconate cycloisomerase [Nocardia terpenica]NQE92263.1 3-carboxy-cis,cis-muconate cycloisomerase [Nocardia terpenica]